MSKFQSLIYSSNYDIVFVTETWLTEFIFDQEILPTNYCIFRKDRQSRGGGVMIAIREPISAATVNILPASATDSLEVISVNLILHKPITLCCIYNPPCPNNSQVLKETIQYLSALLQSTANPTIIVGDFNLPDINWDNLMATCTSTSSSDFCDFIFDNALLQINDKPTHTGGNILDLIITNSENSVNNLTIHSSGHLVLSDHFTLTFSLSSTVPSSPHSICKYVYDYPKADYDGLCSYLLDMDFSPCLLSQDVEEVWNIIKSTIYEGMSLFIPMVRLRRYQYPQWYTPELRHLSKCLSTLRKKVSNNPTSYLCNKFAQESSKLSSKTQLAKSVYESKLVAGFADNGNSKIYDYIRSLSRKSTIPSIVTLKSTSASTDQEKAELFNLFFHSVYKPSPSNSSLPASSGPTLSYPSISNISLTELDVFSALSSLDPTKSMGVDGIGPKLLKQCALALYIPLHHLFQLSISNQAIPCEWKHHSITPIYKSGDKSSVSNYRPVSLLCIVSKVLERLIYDNLSKFILSHDVISPSQFGFLKHQSL